MSLSFLSHSTVLAYFEDLVKVRENNDGNFKDDSQDHSVALKRLLFPKERETDEHRDTCDDVRAQSLRVMDDAILRLEVFKLNCDAFSSSLSSIILGHDLGQDVFHHHRDAILSETLLSLMNFVVDEEHGSFLRYRLIWLLDRLFTLSSSISLPLRAASSPSSLSSSSVPSSQCREPRSHLLPSTGSPSATSAHKLQLAVMEVFQNWLVSEFWSTSSNAKRVIEILERTARLSADDEVSSTAISTITYLEGFASPPPSPSSPAPSSQPSRTTALPRNSSPDLCSPSSSRERCTVIPPWTYQGLVLSSTESRRTFLERSEFLSPILASLCYDVTTDPVVIDASSQVTSFRRKFETADRSAIDIVDPCVWNGTSAIPTSTLSRHTPGPCLKYLLAASSSSSSTSSSSSSSSSSSEPDTSQSLSSFPPPSSSSPTSKPFTSKWPSRHCPFRITINSDVKCERVGALLGAPGRSQRCLMFLHLCGVTRRVASAQRVRMLCGVFLFFFHAHRRLGRVREDEVLKEWVDEIATYHDGVISLIAPACTQGKERRDERTAGADSRDDKDDNDDHLALATLCFLCTSGVFRLPCTWLPKGMFTSMVDSLNSLCTDASVHLGGMAPLTGALHHTLCEVVSQTPLPVLACGLGWVPLVPATSPSPLPTADTAASIPPTTASTPTQIESSFEMWCHGLPKQCADILRTRCTKYERLKEKLVM
eukprot:TRINITY_DN818_c0_g1_i2.p1 TRINITY_DN818_c0_g1~~TRINITY_DN818_c0_g1_i2.p1  ORF type:complete len:710 (+),score=125.39 TRINITY_DN818_c0_g1_i2:175-2304(+)